MFRIFRAAGTTNRREQEQRSHNINNRGEAWGLWLFLAGANNAVLINNCQSLSNLTVQLQVTEDLITLEDTGFSVQLNCYPQIGAITPNSTQGTTFPGEVVGQLEWFQYVLI